MAGLGANGTVMQCRSIDSSGDRLERKIFSAETFSHIFLTNLMA
jgi:hypothetical protein